MPGQTVPVTFQHEQEPQRTEQVTLGNAGDDRKEGFIGLAPIDRADVNFQTTIHLEDVGGPSAGLIFALSIYDRLTPGALAGDMKIAGTGEIDVKGNVGPIGGIPFKMAAAHDEGVSTFLVPKDNCDEASSQAPEGMRLVKVENLAGAVHALDELRVGHDVPVC